MVLIMDDKEWLEQLITSQNASRKITIITTTTISSITTPSSVRFINQTTRYHSESSLLDNNSEDLELFTSLTLLSLIILYGIVVFSGSFGNSTLLVSLCSQSASRTRNPLLLALCFADLLVSLVSAPLTIIAILIRQSSMTTVPLANLGCKLFHYCQTFPVAASSLCLLMLSLDRYATVKHSRFTHLRQRHYVPSVLAIAAWLGSSVLCLPFLFAYSIADNIDESVNASSSVLRRASGHQLNSSSTFILQNDSLINGRRLCISNYGADEWHLIFIISYVGIAFVVPCLGIIFNHLGVRRKLCALSLTARAQHGELPLPMPTILRRPTHMILVTGMTPNGLNNVQETSNDDFLSPLKSSNSNSRQQSAGSENGINRLNNRRFNGASNDRNGGGGEGGSSSTRIQMNRTCGLTGTDDESRKLMETKFQASPRIPKSIRRTKPQQVKSRVVSPPRPPAELPLPQTSTLRSRKRLANILVAAGIVFAICWTPHVYCLISREFSINEGCSVVASEFFMLLGFAHSAVSPIIHWILNFNSLKQSTCQPFAKLSSAQRFLRSRLRFTGQHAPPPASSTNEAALGAFNPKFIKTRPQLYKPPASSHYLY